MNIYKLASGVRLWLDDVRDPQNRQIQREFGAKGDELWVKTVEEAKKYLIIGNVTFISFDNDLGLSEEGGDLAKWIEEKAFHKELPKMDWTVHSKNPVGAKNIYMAMMNANKYWTQV